MASSFDAVKIGIYYEMPFISTMTRLHLCDCPKIMVYSTLYRELAGVEVNTCREVIYMARFSELESNVSGQVSIRSFGNRFTMFTTFHLVNILMLQCLPILRKESAEY